MALRTQCHGTLIFRLDDDDDHSLCVPDELVQRNEEDVSTLASIPWREYSSEALGNSGWAAVFTLKLFPRPFDLDS